MKNLTGFRPPSELLLEILEIKEREGGCNSAFCVNVSNTWVFNFFF